MRDQLIVWYAAKKSPRRRIPERQVRMSSGFITHKVSNVECLKWILTGVCVIYQKHMHTVLLRLSWCGYDASCWHWIPYIYPYSSQLLAIVGLLQYHKNDAGICRLIPPMSILNKRQQNMISVLNYVDRLHDQLLETLHEYIIKWKHFSHYWPIGMGIHRHRWISLTMADDRYLIKQYRWFH